MIVNIILVILAIFASVLGILLSLLLLFLIVPIRYRGKISKFEEIDSDVSIHWFFSILYGKIGYHNEKLNIVLCIFGFPIWNNGEKKQKRIKAKNQKRIKIKKQEPAAVLPYGEENNESPLPAKEEKTVLHIKNEDAYEKDNADDIKKNGRLRNFLHGLAEKFRRFIQAVRSIPKNFHKFLDSIKHLFNNLDLILKFFKSEINQQGFQSIYHTVKKLIKHLKPGRWKLSVHFGLDDPSLTGQILGGAALLYPKFGNQLKVIPDFENQVLEGQFECKGRIRTGTLLFYFLILLTKPEFRQLLKNFKILKEEL